MIHRLKTVEPFFSEIKAGNKTFEIRKEDRRIKFAPGDILSLDKFERGHLTGHCILKEVTYILRDAPEFGLMLGYCIMGLK